MRAPLPTGFKDQASPPLRTREHFFTRHHITRNTLKVGFPPIYPGTSRWPRARTASKKLQKSVGNAQPIAEDSHTVQDVIRTAVCSANTVVNV
jgi:hypothetical protein